MLNRDSFIGFILAGWSVLDTFLCYLCSKRADFFYFPFKTAVTRFICITFCSFRMHHNLQAQAKISALLLSFLQFVLSLFSRDVSWIMSCGFHQNEPLKITGRALVFWFGSVKFGLLGNVFYTDTGSKTKLLQGFTQATSVSLQPG